MQVFTHTSEPYELADESEVLPTIENPDQYGGWVERNNDKTKRAAKIIRDAIADDRIEMGRY